MDIYDITASALTAQRLRLDTISSNLANVNTTRAADGSRGAYRRKNVVFGALLSEAEGAQAGQAIGSPNQKTSFKQAAAGAQIGVQVVQIAEDTETPTRKVYEPEHPDADEKGFVEYPNINTVTEMVDMIAASRAYEATVTAFQTAKAMGEATLQM